MKTKTSFILIALAALPVTAYAHESGEILIRSRAAYIQPVMSTSNQATPLTANNNVDASGAMIPELDFSYFVAKNVALELILGTSRHDLFLDGAKLGQASVLPPTITAQYHFADMLGKVTPYLGAGVNVSYFYNSNIATGSTPLYLSKTSFGPAFQLGADLPVTDHFFVNFDIKKIFMGTDVSLSDGGAAIATAKINPMVWGFGIGVKL